MPDPAGLQLEAIWDAEWRTTLLDAALARVQARVDARQWQIFDLYAIQEWPVAKAAKALGVSTGRVYLTKHRVWALLKKELKRLERTATDD